MFATKNKQEFRKAICLGCKYRRKDFVLFGFTIFKRTPQCKVCKCSIFAKVLFKASSCPKKYW